MLLPCALVHHSGTMIRFRTSQLASLPEGGAEVSILLPNGSVVTGRMNRNRANPNITGPDLVRYIKSVVPYGKADPFLMEYFDGGLSRIIPLNDTIKSLERLGAKTKTVDAVRNAVRTPSLHDICMLLKKADESAGRKARTRTYGSLIRPRGLNKMLANQVGSSCQVEGCSGCADFERRHGNGSGRLILDVHHVEPLCKKVDNNPYNICLLCASHHVFIHRSGSFSPQTVGLDIILQSSRGSIKIARNTPEFASLVNEYNRISLRAG